MTGRSSLGPKDREARSRLIQLLAAAEPLARASLVTMARRCGKDGCRCRHKGQEHVSLYLAARVGKERKMLYVPREFEQDVRSMVERATKAQELLDQMSQASIQGFVERKAKREGGARR